MQDLKDKGKFLFAHADSVRSGVNGSGTDQQIDTPLTQRRSRPVRLNTGGRVEIVDAGGIVHGPFSTLLEAANYAKKVWPDQEQGSGWDVQVAGFAETPH